MYSFGRKVGPQRVDVINNGMSFSSLEVFRKNPLTTTRLADVLVVDVKIRWRRPFFLCLFLFITIHCFWPSFPHKPSYL